MLSIPKQYKVLISDSNHNHLQHKHHLNKATYRFWNSYWIEIIAPGLRQIDGQCDSNVPHTKVDLIFQIDGLNFKYLGFQWKDLTVAQEQTHVIKGSWWKNKQSCIKTFFFGGEMECFSIIIKFLIIMF